MGNCWVSTITIHQSPSHLVTSGKWNSGTVEQWNSGTVEQ